MGFDFTLGRKNKRYLFGWENLDLPTFSSSKPIVFVFGGSGTDSRRVANRYANVVESMLGTFANDVDIITMNYNFEELKRWQEDSFSSSIVQYLFMPRVLNNGQKIDVDNACKKMRDISVFAHCYGSYFMELIEKKLVHCLENVGYTKEETNKIMSQIFVVSFGARKNSGKIPSLDVLSVTDEYFYDASVGLSDELLKNVNKIVMSPLDREKFQTLTSGQMHELLKTINNRCYVLPAENKIKLISSNFSNEDYGNHGIAFLKRTNDWTSEKQITTSGDCVARCIAAALCNSVANSLKNRSNDQFINFDIEELRYQLEEICIKVNQLPLDSEQEASLR